MPDDQYAQYLANEESKAQLEDNRQYVANEAYRKSIPSAMNQTFDDYILLNDR